MSSIGSHDEDLPSIANLLDHLDELNLENSSDEEKLQEPLILPSQVQRQKEVVLHTDVVFGSKGFVGAFHSQRLQYRKGESILPEASQLLPQPPSLPRTMAIRMPVLAVERYVQNHIASWLTVDDDELLV